MPQNSAPVDFFGHSIFPPVSGSGTRQIADKSDDRKPITPIQSRSSIKRSILRFHIVRSKCNGTPEARVMLSLQSYAPEANGGGCSQVRGGGETVIETLIERVRAGCAALLASNNELYVRFLRSVTLQLSPKGYGAGNGPFATTGSTCMPDDDIVTQPFRKLPATIAAPDEGDDASTLPEASLMATAELKQILDAPAEATVCGDTDVMALDEVAQALGVSLTSSR